MKIGKMILKGCIPVLVVAVLVTFVVINARSSSQDLDQVIIGDFCFTLDSFTDTWHWRVEDLGSGLFRFSGFDHVYPGNSLIGSGHREGIMFYATQTISIPAFDSWCIMSIELHLGTMTGTVDMTWTDWSGAAYAVYQNLTFSAVACPPAPLDATGPRSGDR